MTSRAAPSPGRDLTLPAPAPPAGPLVAVLRFDAGTVAARGRHPPGARPRPAADGPAPGWVVPGDASTVSKSHLLVAFDGASITALDLGSTNGSSLVRGGVETPFAPRPRWPCPTATGSPSARWPSCVEVVGE